MLKVCKPFRGNAKDCVEDDGYYWTNFVPFKESFTDYKEIQSTQGESKARIAEGIRNPINESFQIAQPLEMKKEVQRKLHEQIEVQVVGLLCRIPEK
ncbi:myb family transcription factor PHL8-like [Mercurialis annua]|uniref:myb family transcription factor PHL8-like n=1 Tax=Mercurialis annua TaxID=3986 RepID=UPI0024AE6503|nr:myb family transcription factor PHL8-like [Mercurialis annua]